MYQTRSAASRHEAAPGSPGTAPDSAFSWTAPAFSPGSHMGSWALSLLSTSPDFHAFPAAPQTPVLSSSPSAKWPMGIYPVLSLSRSLARPMAMALASPLSSMYTKPSTASLRLVVIKKGPSLSDDPFCFTQ